MRNYKTLWVVAFIIGIGLVAGILTSTGDRVSGQTTGPASQSCIITSTVVSIGDNISTELVASSSRRAWARFEVPQNATNTMALGFNDNAAVAGQGILLNKANANGASTTPSFELGLNTSLPYTGVVEAISNIGSTTALVTQCIY